MWPPGDCALFGGISDFCNHERIFQLDRRVTDAAAYQHIRFVRLGSQRAVDGWRTILRLRPEA